MNQFSHPQFIDKEGETFYISQLTREIAEKYADWIVKVHNDIPFRAWTVENVLAEQDDYRVFYGKWEISRIAFNSQGNPIGFCIGFELMPDHLYYRTPGIYMHRMSLEPIYRARYVGAILHAESLAQAFARGITIIDRVNSNVIIYGQTNDVPENRNIIEFYSDAGFKVLGEKPYPSWKDIIFGMTQQDFENSRHAQLWRARRMP